MRALNRLHQSNDSELRKLTFLGFRAVFLNTDVFLQELTIGPHQLRALIGLPPVSSGLVIFADDGGEKCLSQQNNYVAAALRTYGQATLFVELLTPIEAQIRRNVFDIDMLSSRLESATKWARLNADLRHLPVGFFGAGTGAAASLVVAAEDPEIAAIVSRAGRSDMAGEALPEVRAPTLLLVGSFDRPLISLNQQAFLALTCAKKILIVPGASRLFEEPETLDQVIAQARSWFVSHFASFLREQD